MKNYSITFVKDNTAATETFGSHWDLLKFVAINRIKDEDFIEMNLNGFEVKGGYDGLVETTIKVAEERKAEEEMIEEMLQAEANFGFDEEPWEFEDSEVDWEEE